MHHTIFSSLAHLRLGILDTNTGFTMDKFDTIRSILSGLEAGASRRMRLLDVGCRDCALKSRIQDMADYEGADLFQNDARTVDHVVDVSRGLPMEDGSFDVVVALDLLEHLDDLQAGLSELLRVSRHHVIIMLPNMAHMTYRMSFLRRGYLNDKYILKFNQGQDRHRWITTGSTSLEFADTFARSVGVQVNTEWFVDSRKKMIFAKLCQMVGATPDAWAIASLHHFRK